MARKVSAGLLMYRRREGVLEVLVAHPGGPMWAKRDEGHWTIPKGLLEPDEDPLETAKREFTEETSFAVTATEFVDLGTVRLKSGKRIHAFGFEGDCDPAEISSNTFEMEWPPRSGRKQSFPEIDRAIFAEPELAKRKLNPAQAPLVDRLIEALDG